MFTNVDKKPILKLNLSFHDYLIKYRIPRNSYKFEGGRWVRNSNIWGPPWDPWSSPPWSIVLAGGYIFLVVVGHPNSNLQSTRKKKQNRRWNTVFYFFTTVTLIICSKKRIPALELNFWTSIFHKSLFLNAFEPSVFLHPCYSSCYSKIEDNWS